MTRSHQIIVAGARYVEQITARSSDRRARAAFQALALSIVPAAGRIFDFGAGPGLDARHYAEHGMTVEAFDIDPQMREFFAQHCRDLIASKRIVLQGGGYRDFIESKEAGERGDFDLITANFAPLNLVDDLNELFAKFHTLTAPRGKVLASVLNPFYFGDLRYRWWWRNAMRIWRHGRFFVQGTQARIHRRRRADFAVQGMPYFALRRVYRGLPMSRRFVFLLFERRPGD